MKKLKNETMKVDKVWLMEVLDLLERVGRDADKLIQPNKIEQDAFRLHKMKAGCIVR